MQYQNFGSDTNAGQYLQRHFRSYKNDNQYPHVAVIDPRTDEQIIGDQYGSSTLPAS